MQRARRFAFVAALTVAGLTALTGCRTNPEVAAYVGPDTYTEAQVTQIYDNAYDTLQAAVREQAERQAAAQPAPSPSPSPAAVPLPITRQDIVLALVGRELFKRAAGALGIAKVDVPPDQLVQQKRLPLESEFMQIWAEHEGYRFALLQKLPGKTPTEADLRDIYNRLVAGGLFDPATLPFNDFATRLPAEQREGAAALMALREAMQAQVREGDIVVNPRYTPAEIAIDSFADRNQVTRPLIVVQLETDPGEPFVRDAA
jgi:hypothetical protein